MDETLKIGSKVIVHDSYTRKTIEGKVTGLATSFIRVEYTTSFFLSEKEKWFPAYQVSVIIDKWSEAYSALAKKYAECLKSK